jgi:hypothetical protein
MYEDHHATYDFLDLSVTVTIWGLCAFIGQHLMVDALNTLFAPVYAVL